MGEKINSRKGWGEESFSSFDSVVTIIIMISTRLKILFGLSALLLTVHGLEEYFTGLYAVNADVAWLVSFTDGMSISQAVFLTYEIALWVMLFLIFLTLVGGVCRKIVLTMLGLLFFYEITHFIGAFEVGGYYPGLVTALLFPVLGYFYWKELIFHLRS